MADTEPTPRDLELRHLAELLLGRLELLSGELEHLERVAHRLLKVVLVHQK